MLAIILFIIAIVGLVKGNVSLSRTREVRGKWLYVICICFMLPLPLTFAAGFLIGFMNANNASKDVDGLVMMANLILGLGPIALGLVLYYMHATPKVELQNPNRGFDVMPPPPPST